MKLRVDWKAIGAGLATFLVAYVAWTVLTFVAVNFTTIFASKLGSILFQAFSFSVFLVPGYVAAYRASHRRILHGAICGALGVLAAVAVSLFFSGLPLADVVELFAMYAMLGSLGGIIGNHRRNRLGPPSSGLNP